MTTNRELAVDTLHRMQEKMKGNLIAPQWFALIMVLIALTQAVLSLKED